MIKNRADYKEYLSQELSRRVKNRIFCSPQDKFIKSLRRVEYHYNSKGLWHKIMFLFAYFHYRRWSMKSGISISKNCFEKGLSLPHFGSIVVSAACKAGKNCRIQNNVNIGASMGSKKAPKIGDNVYIGPGAVLFGDIEIADNCWIGANAVVNKSFLEPYTVIAGVPGKVVRKETRNWTEVMK